MTPAERAAHRIAADAILTVVADRAAWKVPPQFLDDVAAAVNAIWLDHDETASAVDIDTEW